MFKSVVFTSIGEKQNKTKPTKSAFIRNPKGTSLTQNLKPQLTDDTSVNCKFYF